MSEVERRRGPSTSIADQLRAEWMADWKAKVAQKAHMQNFANAMFKDIGDNYYHLQEPMGKFDFYPETIARSGTFNSKTRNVFASGADEAEALDTIAHELFHAKYAEAGHSDYDKFISVGNYNEKYHKEPPEVWREAYRQRLPSVGPPDTIRWSNEEELADIAANEFIKNNFPNLKAPYAEQVAAVLAKDTGSHLGASSDSEPSETKGLLQQIELIKSKHLPSWKTGVPLWFTISNMLKGR